MAKKRARPERRTPEARAKWNAYMRGHGQRWREAALALYGGKCVRCGFSDSRALQFDHVHGGGNREVRSVKRDRVSYHKHIMAVIDTGKFQLLCANCNWIKRVENGEVRPAV